MILLHAIKVTNINTNEIRFYVSSITKIATHYDDDNDDRESCTDEQQP